MTEIAKLQKLAGIIDVELATLLYEQTEAKVLAMTGRTKLNDALKPVVIDLAVIASNRTGTEGELSRSEGGISITFENIPNHDLKIINQNRIARVGGYAFESTTTEEV